MSVSLDFLVDLSPGFEQTLVAKDLFRIAGL